MPKTAPRYNILLDPTSQEWLVVEYVRGAQTVRGRYQSETAARQRLAGLMPRPLTIIEIPTAAQRLRPPYRCICGVVFATGEDLLAHRHPRHSLKIEEIT